MIASRLARAAHSLPSAGSLSGARTAAAASSSFCQSSQFSTAAKSKKAASDPSKNVVVVDGVRLPFAMTSTIYEDQLAVDLQRLAYQGLITKTALDKSDVDYILAGTVIQEVKTSNIAREAAINAGFPASIGSHTVAMVRYVFLIDICTYFHFCRNLFPSIESSIILMNTCYL